MLQPGTTEMPGRGAAAPPSAGQELSTAFSKVVHRLFHAPAVWESLWSTGRRQPVGKAVDKGITSTLLHSVAQYAEYDFLRDDPRFQNILEECNQILTRDFQSIEA